MSIGLRIKNARLKKGLTQQELGDMLGLQKSAIAKYENGRVVNIKRSTLKIISKVLEIPPFELVYDADLNVIQKKNDAITDIILRLQNDDDFYKIVTNLYNMDTSKIASLLAFLE